METAWLWDQVVAGKGWDLETEMKSDWEGFPEDQQGPQKMSGNSRPED